MIEDLFYSSLRQLRAIRWRRRLMVQQRLRIASITLVVRPEEINRAEEVQEALVATEGEAVATETAAVDTRVDLERTEVGLDRISPRIR